MVHLTNTSRSSIFRFGIGMLVLFFFLRPVHAQMIPFQSTSNRPVISQPISNSINGSSNSNIVGEYKPYRPNVYVPFGDETPSSGNPLNNNGSGGSGDPNDDIGIPGWADTPSEPLPIGDSTPLFWLAAAMIAIIRIRQRRKQKQLSTQTSNNHSNNDTNEMTLTQHTRKSFRKFLMLALLLCVVGEVSADGVPSKIYFRPSTTNFTNGYTNLTTASAYNTVYWTKGVSNFFPIELRGSGKSSSFTSFNDLDWAKDINNGDISRFIPITVPTGYTHVIAYRAVYSGTWNNTNYSNWTSSGGKHKGNSSTIENQNTVPQWTNSTTHLPSSPEPIPTDGRNLLCNKEGWWDVWYWAYYLPTTNDVKIYFAKVDNWEGRTDVKLLTGKDIYTYETVATTQTIDHTKLAYFSLNGSEFGYLDYGFIGGTNSWSSSKTIPSVGGSENQWVYDVNSSHANNKTDAAKNSNSNLNRIANRRTYSAYYTKTQSNLLSGYNLFIPGKANEDASLTQIKFNNITDLNRSQTVKVLGEGTIKYYTYIFSGKADDTSRNTDSVKLATVNFEAAYTATVSLKATPLSGFTFVGWFEEGSSTPLSTETSYSYTVPNASKNIVAKFANKKKFRMQIFENKDDLNIYDKDDWTDSNLGGTLTIQYTKTDDGTTYTETIDDATQHPKDDIHPEKTLTVTATPKDGYTFIGFWNNESGQIFGKNPWSMTPMDQDESVTARFAKTYQQKVYAYTYNTETDVYDAEGTNGGSVSIEYPKIAYTNVGCEKASATTTSAWSDNVLAENTTMTITASAADGYEFLGWYSTAGEPIDWMNQEGAKVSYTANAAYTIVARFHKPFSQAFDVQTEISGQYQNSTTGGTATITYNDATTNITDQKLSLPFEQGTMVTLNATPKDGYRFVGWFQNDGTCWTENPYTYRAEGARTLHARFVKNDITLSVAVLNYNPEYDKFEEYGYEYNTITLKENSTVLKESYSSFKHKFENATTVTLTATPEDGEDGYDFVGWYIGNEKLTAGTNSLYKLTAANPTELTLYLSSAVAVNAHFAPKKCYQLEIRNNIGGTYTVRFSRNENFEQAFGMESSLDEFVYTYIPYVNENDGVYMSVLNPKPILGYEFKGWRILDHGSGSKLKGLGDKFYYKYPAETQVVANFVRKDDQVVYLNLDGLEIIPNEWNLKADTATKYYAFAFNTCNSQQRWIEMTKVSEKLYTCTIPGGEYNRINFVHSTKLDLAENLNPKIGLNYLRDSLKQECRRSGFQTIPATRYNCFRIRGVYSSKTENGGPGYVDGWVAPPTTTGDYRLIYREQTVVDKNTIDIDYEFNEGDRIKKITSGTKLDTVSLHIYNKVSGNVNGVNNPEVILQQWDGTAWIDVERYMVFGPLRSNNPGVIKMPNRKNTSAKIVVDKGIDNIMTDETDDGCGVWNFVIEQDGTTARLLVDKTHRYTGNYYIRTTNADGQYHNFTHPGNIMSFSEYAKNHSNYSHYFIRYVDIYEDGTKTAEAGKHPVVKFCVATDYAYSICKEFLNINNRFDDDEYGEDVYVINDNDLPADATVRFGWDIKTNRLTRAYIASTFQKNNEYLVVEGNYIGDPTGDATYFNDNSNHLYSINLPNAKANATAKVKAKMNGKYQYFLGTEQEDASLISGNGENNYPIRLLYDFKDDRFTTIYQPASGTINNDVQLTTPLMIEREHNGQATQIVLTTNKITTVEAGQDQFTQPAYAVMTFLEEVLADASKTHHEKMFYWISFPFDVKISDVFGLGDYGKYWIMEEYNGKQRAASGLAQNNWKYITKKSHILKKDTGYVLCLNYSQILQDKLFKSYGSNDQELNSGKLSLYFPSNGIVDPKSIVGGQSATIDLEEYYNANTAWNHHNWHIIGVPSFANPGTIDEQQDAPFVYVYWHPSDAYAAVSINEVKFQSMHAYMVQYAGEITWTNKIVNTGGNVSGGKSLAAKTDEEAEKKIMLRLELQQAGSTIDKTYVQLRNDKGTKGFDMSLDLTKIINAGANIYSIVDNHEMAGNAIPKEETVLPLGVVITAAGEYNFAMPNGTEGMIVELIDYEQGTSTNLLMSDYTVNMPVGTNNTRFALRLVPEKVATSVEDITSGTNDNNVRKLLIDGVLYLVKDGAVYDAQGHCVR